MEPRVNDDRYVYDKLITGYSNSGIAPTLIISDIYKFYNILRLCIYTGQNCVLLYILLTLPKFNSKK